MTEKIRIDKWLWSVRIYKSRTQASDACSKGHILVNDEKVKPSFLVEVGKHIVVRKNGYDYQYEVIKLISKRVSAPLAQVCYVNHTPEDELNKFADWYIGKSSAERRVRGSGRPTKRERREIDKFKNH